MKNTKIVKSIKYTVDIIQYGRKKSIKANCFDQSGITNERQTTTINKEAHQHRNNFKNDNSKWPLPSWSNQLHCKSRPPEAQAPINWRTAMQRCGLFFFISNSKPFPVQIQVRYAFKIKSTNNDHYRVNPVYGIVEPGAAAQVEVTRLVGFNLFWYVSLD